MLPVNKLVAIHACCDLFVGTVYVYLASGAGRDLEKEEGTFRALTRGYTHWASGRISQIEVNLENPMYCHVRSTMSPSMKQGNSPMAVAGKKMEILLLYFQPLVNV